MDKETAKYMEQKIKEYKELDKEINTCKQHIEKLTRVKDDNPLLIYLDSISFVLTPKIVKIIKKTLENEYNAIILENENKIQKI